MNTRKADVDWLGEDDAHLATEARAGLGILVAADQWAWWDSPQQTLEVLSSVVPRNGRVKWGGDASVAEAARWVDPLRAIAVAHAFRALPRLEITLKIQRSVWNWPDGAKTIDRVLTEFSKLLGPGGVFPEWMTSSKSRLPSGVSPDTGRLLSSLTLPASAFDARPTDHVSWMANLRIADIVVADSIESLQGVTAAHVIVLYGEKIDDLVGQVWRLRESLSAQCVIQVHADPDQIVPWLHALVETWARPRWSLADALNAATRRTQTSSRVLSTTQRLLFSTSWFHKGFPPFPTGGQGFFERVPQQINETSDAMRAAGEEEDGSFFLGAVDKLSAVAKDALAEVSNTQRPLSDSMARDIQRNPDRPSPKFWRPAPPMARVLDATVRTGGKAVRTWPSEGEVSIDVRICTQSPLHGSRPSFPVDRIEWEDNQKTLQVHMLELGKPPITRELVLPRSEDSAPVSFVDTASNRPIDIRFIVSDGARILQTSRLQAAPNSEIRFFIENLITPVHKVKDSFDVAMLVNESLGMQPSMTVITEGGDTFLSPLTSTEVEDARTGLLRVLERAVANPAEPLAPLLLQLASLGSSFLKELRERVPTWPGSCNRIQLVTQSNAFFPVEYLYDGVMPESTKAQLCSMRKGCMKSGNDMLTCPTKLAQAELCTRGFVGVSGIVERHTWRPGSTSPIWGQPEGLARGGDRIRDLSKIALAASDLADEFDDEEVHPHEPVRIADLAKALAAPRIPNWDEWKQRIAQAPSMLVLIVHMENEAVHIGKDLGVNLGSLSPQYVGNAPMTIAIGCSTGVGRVPGSGLSAALRRSGARVVIATMTGVLGRHANRATRELALRLKEAAKSSSATRVGEIVREVRRGLLDDGLALGLAVVAFGDADVVLGG